MRTILPHTENPALRATMQEIPLADITSPRIQELIIDMHALLAVEEHGVALAAPQVGEAVRLFIVSADALEKREDKYRDTVPADAVPAAEHVVYINPRFDKVSRGTSDKHEGCLSIRGKWGVVPRAEKATITAYDEHGKKFTRGASGFLAHIFQHEMDHLDGVLYIDKATELYNEGKQDEDND
jgi:peptide deformylase